MMPRMDDRCCVNAIPHDPIDSVYAVCNNGRRRDIPPELWRGIATRLASRWYTRIGLLRAADRTASDEAEIDRYEAQLAMHPATYERSDIRAYIGMRQAELPR